MKIYLETDDTGSIGIIEKLNDRNGVDSERFPKNRDAKTAARRLGPKVMRFVEDALASGRIVTIDADDHE